jgi:hypothetical protein
MLVDSHNPLVWTTQDDWPNLSGSGNVVAVVTQTTGIILINLAQDGPRMQLAYASSQLQVQCRALSRCLTCSVRVHLRASACMCVVVAGVFGILIVGFFNRTVRAP